MTRTKLIFQILSFIGLIFICAETLVAQDYKAIIKSDTSTWRLAHKQLARQFIDTIYAASMEGNYTNLRYRGTMNYGDYAYVGKLRMNPNNSKLWYIAPNETEEVLIFDLSLIKGDEFDFNSFTSKVDTVYYMNNLKYIEFETLTDWDEKIRFIEGVGPNIRLLWAWESSGILSPYCVCKYDYGNAVYINNNEHFNQCNLNTTGMNHFVDFKSIMISPNPVKNKFEIKLDNIKSFKKIELIISDINGRILLKQKIVNNQNIIDISEYIPGIYLLRINFNNSISESFKIIKQ